MTAVLEVRGATKAYGERAVLRGIDLAVEEHAAVALIGASGSGKSTLLRCIDLLEEIDDGDDGLRARGRRRGLLPARRADRRARRPGADLHRPRAAETQRFLRRLLEAGRP